jgi:hypothetical protein
MADATARIQLYPAHQTGLLNPIRTGFRSPLKWEDETRSNHFNACTFEMRAGEEHSAGETFVCSLWFLSRDSLETNLKVGSKFKLWSSGFIGEGVITEVLLGRAPAGKDYLDDDKKSLY